MVRNSFLTADVPIEFINTSEKVELWIKRDDLIDPQVSGNKLYKLKYNLDKAKRAGRLLTFGGAYSNHIAATARFCRLNRLPCIGLIRGEPTEPLNPTLRQAQADGMTLEFMTRSDYRQKNDPAFLQRIAKRFPDAWIVPEGGSNQEGIEGAREMLNASTKSFDIIATAVGTGTTAAGLLQACASQQRILGIPIHRHYTVVEELKTTLPYLELSLSSYETLEGADLGGYAKWNEALILFIKDFYQRYGIKLDPIYTGKALMHLMSEIRASKFPAGSRILFLHSGGLQGIEGFEERHGIHLFADS